MLLLLQLQNPLWADNPKDRSLEKSGDPSFAEYYVGDRAMVSSIRGSMRNFVKIDQSTPYIKNLPTVIRYSDMTEEYFQENCWRCVDGPVTQYIPETNEIWVKPSSSAETVYREILRMLYYQHNIKPRSQIYEDWVSNEIQFLAKEFVEFKKAQDYDIPISVQRGFYNTLSGTSILDMPGGP